MIGVDLGVNTDAVCAAVQEDGTVTGQRFINSPVEKDRMYGLLNTIKKAQQNGCYKTPAYGDLSIITTEPFRYTQRRRSSALPENAKPALLSLSILI